MACPECSAEFELKEYSPGHVGIDVYRCNKCARSVVKHKSSIPPNYDSDLLIEDYMSDCQCGDRFSRNARQRCPQCNAILDIAKIVGRPDTQMTKRDSGEFYVVGYECELTWKIQI